MRLVNMNLKTLGFQGGDQVTAHINLQAACLQKDVSK